MKHLCELKAFKKKGGIEMDRFVVEMVHQENPRKMMPHLQRSIGKMGRDVAWDLKTSVCDSIRNHTSGIRYYV